MAIFPGKEQVLQAANSLRDVLLERRGTLLSVERVWLAANMQELRRRFVEQPLDDDRKFLDKLEAQLKEAPPAAIQLMVEILWSLYLFPTGIGSAKKREKLEQVWNWSQAPFPVSPLLADDVLIGIGSGGPGFNNHFWREVAMAIQLFADLLALDVAARTALVEDAYGLARWIDGKPYADGRQFRHMLLHLWYPQTFERISSNREKRAILAGFGVTGWEAEEPTSPRLAADRALLSLREGLDDPTADFYHEPLKGKWRGTSAAPSQEDEAGLEEGSPNALLHEAIKAGAQFWMLDAKRGNEDKTETFVDQGLWMSPSEDKYKDQVLDVRPGDYVAIKQVNWCTHLSLAELGGRRRRCLRIKAVGRVRANPGDGQVLHVDWQPDFVALDLHGWAYFPPISIVKHQRIPHFIRRAYFGEPQPGPGENAPLLEEADALAEILDHHPINRIYYGPPGTGKTYQLEGGLLERYAEYLALTPNGERCVEVVTFHQSFGYEEFVEGLGTDVVDGAVVYRPKEGIFVRLCRRAEKHPDRRFAIFIDEINRGNVSKVFGELITLIEPEKRQPFLDTGEPDTRNPVTQVRLPYSGQLFGVPVNVDIIATMNTADRSLTRMDTALRRRFEFHEVLPDPRLLDAVVVEGVEIGRMLAVLNQRIEVLYDRDHMLGHAFFMPLKTRNAPLTVANDLAPIFRTKILPLLEEYFFDDWEKIRLVLGDNQKAHRPDLQFVARRTVGDVAALFGAEGQLVAQGADDGLYQKNPRAFEDPRAFQGIYEQV